MLFLSTDLPALLYSTPKTGKLDYPLLSDNELKAAEAMHIAYHVDDATYAKRLTYGGFGEDDRHLLARVTGSVGLHHRQGRCRSVCLLER